MDYWWKNGFLSGNFIMSIGKYFQITIIQLVLLNEGEIIFSDIKTQINYWNTYMLLKINYKNVDV